MFGIPDIFHIKGWRFCTELQKMFRTCLEFGTRAQHFHIENICNSKLFSEQFVSRSVKETNPKNNLIFILIFWRIFLILKQVLVLGVSGQLVRVWEEQTERSFGWIRAHCWDMPIGEKAHRKKIKMHSQRQIALKFTLGIDINLIVFLVILKYTLYAKQ